ncbi:hypothetical protein ACA910_007454 [Epithemia clementina (nom. ined.)]
MPTTDNASLPGSKNMDNVQQKFCTFSGGKIGSSINNNQYYQRVQLEVMQASLQQEQLSLDFQHEKDHIWHSKYWSNNNNMAENIDAQQQKVALIFLGHFVGNIHQPLHVSHQSNKGDNEIFVELQN